MQSAARGHCKCVRPGTSMLARGPHEKIEKKKINNYLFESG